jgi:uncharacterized protein with HEPN domain
MPLPNAAYLGHMLSAMGRLSEILARTDRDTFDCDWVTQNAVIRELEVLGEAAGRLSPAFVAAHPEVPWREITGMRHKLIHDYFVVDLGVVWSTATENVPAVEPMIRAAAATLGVAEPPNKRAR